MTRLPGIVLITCCAAGCGYGVTAETFVQRSGPYGAPTRVVTAEAVFEGELLEVQDTGLLILTTGSGAAAADMPERRLRLVPFNVVRSATFAPLNRRDRISDGRPPGAEARERLRLISRFPHGLAPDVLARLLESCGQSDVAGAQP